MGNIFAKNTGKEEYYEKLLTCLQKDIKTRQEFIQKLKSLNRSFQVHLVLFSSVFYGGYSLFLLLQYKFFLSSTAGGGLFCSRQSLAFLGFFPFGVFYLKKGVSALFSSLIGRKEQVLKAKQAQLKDRLEQLKIETHYYKTKDLIDKYETKATTPTPTPTNESSTGASTTKHRLRKSHSNSNDTTKVVALKPTNIPLSSRQYSSPPPPPLSPSPPQIRSPTWMDRFMDALIGDDSRNQKYALICSQCFNHNGLVAPEFFHQVKYKCPNCGFFNFVVRNRKVMDNINTENNNDLLIKDNEASPVTEIKGE